MSVLVTVVVAIFVAIALVGGIVLAMGRRAPSKPLRPSHAEDSGYGEGYWSGGIESGADGGGGGD